MTRTSILALTAVAAAVAALGAGVWLARRRNNRRLKAAQTRRKLP